MLCETLRPCLIAGTAWKEPKMGNRVNVVPQESESVKFFLIDDANNEKCPLKKDLDLTKICDLVVSYKLGQKLKVLCLVELKGNDIPDAINQTSTVYRSLKPRCPDSNGEKIIWMIFISVPGCVPIKIRGRDLTEKINEKCGIKAERDRICCKVQKTSGKDELGRFIRSNCIQS
jgi:hypothetical protein